MKNKLKKIVIFILILIIIVIKIFQINFVEKVKNKIENFEKLENSYCNQILLTKNQKTETTRIVKNRKIKEIIFYSNSGSVIRLIDLDKNEEVTIDEISNTYLIEKNKQNNDIKIKNLPKILDIKNNIDKSLENGNMFSLFYCFKILYIIPIQYNGVECYEIRTFREKIYIDKNTLYPMSREIYKDNSKDNNEENTKIEYVFEENNVKDEDIEFPNLDNYKLFDEEANKSK